MKDLNFNTILEIVTHFYERATRDILIGYHFRVIHDFDTHLSRIASFWQLQLTGEIDAKEELPFNLIMAHKPLMIRTGEVNRWEVLFQNSLDEFILQKKISPAQKDLWTEKIKIFKKRLLVLC